MDHSKKAAPGRNPLLTPVILCILVTETGERFAYFGFRAVLVLYFSEALEYSDSQAIALFAYTTCLAYLSPLAGALLADGLLGRYTTILYFGFLYVVGLAILTLGAWCDTEHQLHWKRFLSFSGLFLVCAGTGGIKPCVSAFGADQVAARKPLTTQAEAEVATLVSSSATTTIVEATAVRFAENEIGFTEDNADNEGLPVADAIFKEDPPFDPRETAAGNEIGLSSDEHQAEQVRVFFSYFYFCINVGAVTSIALVPLVRGFAGFGGAFLLACLFMITAMILFFSHRHEYVHHEPGKDGSSMLTTFRLCWWLLRRRIWSHQWIARTFPTLRPSEEVPQARRRQHVLVPSEENDQVVVSNGNVVGDEQHDIHDQHDEIMRQQLDDAAQALHVLPIMAMMPLFWSLYDQQGSVWTLQAKRMALHGLKPEQLNVVNPLEIMIFIPLFDRIIYPAMEHWDINIAPLRRMSWGMLLTAVAFFVSGLVESSIQYREANDLSKLNVFWQLPQITILAVGEIFLSVTGLEFAYSTSPARLKAFLMAIFLLTTAVGDFFSGILYSTVFANLNMAIVMHICAVLMLGNLGLFCWVARWWEKAEFQDLRRAGSMQGLEFQDRQID